MFHKLTDKIWWGDRYSPIETAKDTKACISICHNQELTTSGAQLYKMLPHYKPFFWLPRPDGVAVDDNYMEILDCVCCLIQKQELFPVCINCYAGLHRSTAVACYLHWSMTGENPLDKARAMHPRIEIHEFGQSLYNRMKPKE